jgi:hypothetical protein
MVRCQTSVQEERTRRRFCYSSGGGHHVVRGAAALNRRWWLRPPRPKVGESVVGQMAAGPGEYCWAEGGERKEESKLGRLGWNSRKREYGLKNGF